jgi:hypothetical protein
MKRKRIALNPNILEMLEEYKTNIQWHATKGRVPLSWNDFFVIIISDWENGRSKCICGSFYDCQSCHTEKALATIKLGGDL